MAIRILPQDITFLILIASSRKTVPVHDVFRGIGKRDLRGSRIVDASIAPDGTKQATENGNGLNRVSWSVPQVAVVVSPGGNVTVPVTFTSQSALNSVNGSSSAAKSSSLTTIF